MTASSDNNLNFNDGIITPSKIRTITDIPKVQQLPHESIDYVVAGLLPRKTVMLLAGKDGCMKSTLAQCLSISAATGREFLGRRCQQMPVLILDYENPLFEIRQRLDLLTAEQGEPDQLWIWGTWLEEQPPMLGNELLLTMAKETKPLIIIDTLRAAHSGDENSSSDMQGIMNVLRYCASQGATVVILHHLGKGEGSQFRGSTAITGAVDISFVQTLSDETGLITLQCTKNRFGPKISFTLKPDFNSGTLEVVDSPEFARYNAELKTLQKIIQQNPGASQNRICDLAGLMRSRVIRLLKDNTGKLWKTEVGANRSSLYYPISEANSPVVLSFPEPLRTTEPLEWNSGGSGGSPLKGREPQNHHPENHHTQNHPSQNHQKPNGRSSACPECGAGCIDPLNNGTGNWECNTCHFVGLPVLK